LRNKFSIKAMQISGGKRLNYRRHVPSSINSASSSDARSDGRPLVASFQAAYTSSQHSCSQIRASGRLQNDRTMKKRIVSCRLARTAAGIGLESSLETNLSLSNRLRAEAPTLARTLSCTQGQLGSQLLRKRKGHLGTISPRRDERERLPMSRPKTLNFGSIREYLVNLAGAGSRCGGS